jgi:hypothetical protein
MQGVRSSITVLSFSSLSVSLGSSMGREEPNGGKESLREKHIVGSVSENVHGGSREFGLEQSVQSQGRKRLLFKFLSIIPSFSRFLSSE